MLARTERIDGFHRKVSRTEKAFYERFRQTQEAEVLTQMRASLTERMFEKLVPLAKQGSSAPLREP
jgi:hypothetical protein